MRYFMAWYSRHRILWQYRVNHEVWDYILLSVNSTTLPTCHAMPFPILPGLQLADIGRTKLKSGVRGGIYWFKGYFKMFRYRAWLRQSTGTFRSNLRPNKYLDPWTIPNPMVNPVLLSAKVCVQVPWCHCQCQLTPKEHLNLSWSYL